ncbi:hypothetical protein BCR34DRAFT_625171 [Clohesyomyces aquaticus]|uniref:Cation-transporting P-type ATPase N-terminal domain-containing protein n=1 Tax=Clohesyomyces aquaticus TaxID=1231657 RepID=A0A1Y1ZKF7_9PLEO|nr:hypothetical protein BCR34DRAFT_625171 [Clohesyomyces aquaticus]
MQSENKNANAPRIQYAEDEENHIGSHERRPSRRHLSRRSGVGSMSIYSMNRTMEPESVLPITYRTLSIEVDEYLQKKQRVVKRAKDKAVVDLTGLDWHSISLDELYSRLSTYEAQGLSQEQVQRCVTEYGKNKPSPPPSRLFQKITGHFFGGFGSILLIAGILSSSRVMASITTMLPDQCLDIRNGAQNSITATDLVPEDVIVIKQGNKLPADCRFVEVSGDAMFDRAILTGESEPVVAGVESSEDNYLETNNIGLQGTHRISGSCLGIVVATGDNTVFGRIATLANDPKIAMTTLQKEILRFVLIIALFIVVAAWLRKSYPEWITVPLLIVDCLQIALTTSLTIVANIMRMDKILCKSLKTVETLGAISVICSDKTGTLTKNKMVMTDIFAGGEEYTPESARDLMDVFRSESNVAAAHTKKKMDVIDQLRIPLRDRNINGGATDQAVLRLSESLGSVAKLRQDWKKVYEIGFSSKNKFMVRIMTPLDQEAFSNSTLLMIKGAPDILLARYMKRIEDVKDFWSRQGKRVILLAQKTSKAPSSNNHEREVLVAARQGLTFVGLIGIVDPPRDEIPEVVKILRGASIRIFMVTGDFKLTAQAIAEDCGIISNSAMIDGVDALSREVKHGFARRSIVLSGPELLSFNENQWDQLCQYQEIAFARTTPEQKLRIVKELQARDEIVGMTGDGVNDAPPFKAADIGIPMRSGSDIAIEAADMYGRLVYDNLKKTIVYLLPAGSFSELCTLSYGNCFTDCAAAITLAYEKSEADLLRRPPRNPKKDRLVDPKLIFHAYFLVGLLERFISFAMAFWYMERKGVPFSAMWLKYDPQYDPDYVTAVANEASSIYFVNLVVTQLFNLLATRTRRLSLFQQPPIFNKDTQNLFLFPAMIFAIVIVFIFCYTPGLQRTIATTTVPVEHFSLPVTFGLGLLCLDEGRKYAVRTWPKGFFVKIAW